MGHHLKGRFLYLKEEIEHEEYRDNDREILDM
jgi:hypothetical protein